MGSHLGETGMLGWERDVAVDGVHGEQGKDFTGAKQEGLRAGCRRSWSDELLSSGCPQMPLAPHLTISYQHCVCPVSNRVVFALGFA